MRTVSNMKNGCYPQEGLGIISHIAGLLGQRLWFYKMTAGYSCSIKISDNCIGCGKCTFLCPMQNLTIHENKAEAGSHCTMCYRCISTCPRKAITLLGKSVYEQCRYENYTGGAGT